MAVADRRDKLVHLDDDLVALQVRDRGVQLGGGCAELRLGDAMKGLRVPAGDRIDDEGEIGAPASGLRCA
ncbi:MAG TPA: hypothetical protein VFI25_14105 [Planctomycetota bacterium]|nr:hypothetical protein [Planctomycetota bacterium]